MGARVSKYSSTELKPKEVHPNNRASKQVSCIIELLKPECLKAKKMKKKRQLMHQPEKNSPKVSKLTLEDWFISSPSLKTDYSKEGELCVLKPFSKRVHPSPIGHNSMSSTAGESFSLERLVMLDRMAEEDNIISVTSMDVSSISTRKSGKLKKRVSFKLPEVAQIIIFNSPKESMDSDQEYSE